jgi:hypothetical protein
MPPWVRGVILRESHSWSEHTGIHLEIDSTNRHLNLNEDMVAFFE